MSLHPEVKWAQSMDKVFLTVILPDAKNPKVNLEPVGVFTFSGTAGAENSLYELKLDLHDKVNVEESKISIGVRNIFCVLEKAEMKWWKRLSRGDGKEPHYVKVDWDKWVDEDEDNGPGDIDMDGMDFSKLGGMSGLADDDEFDESDDEDEEVKKPVEIADDKAGKEAKPEENRSTKVEGEGTEKAAPSS